MEERDYMRRLLFAFALTVACTNTGAMSWPAMLEQTVRKVCNAVDYVPTIFDAGTTGDAGTDASED